MSTAHPGRIDWVDAAKGIGILLVVIGHTIVGLRDGDIISASSVLIDVHHLIYTFHMPLFFFLSGIFIAKRVNQGAFQFAKNSTLKLGRAYLIWSPVQMLILSMAGSLANGSVDNSFFNYASILWDPRANFWFLYALILMNLLSALIIPRFGTGALVITCVLLYAMAQWVKLPSAWSGLCWFSLYYAFGVIHGQNNVQLKTNWALQVFAATACTLVWFYTALHFKDTKVVSATIATLTTAIIGSLATILWVGLFRNKILDLFSYLGRESLPIYLVHIIFAAGARIVLHNFLGIDSAGFILTAAVLAGLVGPLLVKHFANRLGIADKIGLA